MELPIPPATDEVESLWLMTTFAGNGKGLHGWPMPAINSW